MFTVSCPICGETRQLTNKMRDYYPSGVGRCKQCSDATNNLHKKGAEHPGWKGDKAKSRTGQYRARVLYPILGKCQFCDKPAIERHHKDGNCLNNSLENVLSVCRHHHMKIDGRLSSLAVLANQHRQNLHMKTIAKKCITCGQAKPPYRKGKCHACNEYFRRHGVDRPCHNGPDGHRVENIPRSKPVDRPIQLSGYTTGVRPFSKEQQCGIKQKKER